MIPPIRNKPVAPTSVLLAGTGGDVRRAVDQLCLASTSSSRESTEVEDQFMLLILIWLLEVFSIDPSCRFVGPIKTTQCPFLEGSWSYSSTTSKYKWDKVRSVDLDAHRRSAQLA
jgi:hypothetical protein